MELSDLRNSIISAFSGTSEELQMILQAMEEDRAIFPFNEYEHTICYMIEHGGMSYQQYLDIRAEYISTNPNLWIFEISAPRNFGEKFAQTFVMGKCASLQTPSKKADPNYIGEYDLWLDGIKIEVKASRAVNSDSEEPLYVKALSRNSQKNFLMNFQQLKPQFCDVFIWVAVFRDDIVLWIMNSSEVVNHPLYSIGQHRGNTGNEGQLHINQNNIEQFKTFELKDNNLEHSVRAAALRHTNSLPK